MGYTPPSASDDLPDSQIWGAPVGKKIMPFGNPAAYMRGAEQDTFYDSRDDMVGGTDTEWTPDWSSAGDNAPVQDAAMWSTSGPLSQSDLA